MPRKDAGTLANHPISCKLEAECRLYFFCAVGGSNPFSRRYIATEL